MTNKITIDLTPVPSRKRPSTFSEDGDTFLKKLPAWTDQANQLGAKVNADTATVDAKTNITIEKTETATIAASTAESVANFKGNWSELSGSLSPPASVANNGKIWLLLTHLTDICTSEPTMLNTDWLYFDKKPFSDNAILAQNHAIALYF